VKALPNPDQQGERVLEDGEYLARTQPLDPGHYWKAKKAIRKGLDENGIPAGCVLLLQRIKRVDDKPHAVELAGHPLLHPESTFEFLVHDFLNKFDPEPNGAAIRAREMGELRAKIDEQQRQLLDFTSSPAAMIEELRKNPRLEAPEERRRDDRLLPTAPFDFAAGLPGRDFRPSTSIAALADGRDQEEVDLFRRQAENQAILAKKRAELIQERTTAIAKTVQQLTPFYEEQGAVALAQSQDALDIYHKLRHGLATLGLYTGKDVELTEVRTGAAAAIDEPVHILQALMFMDEESLINTKSGGADFSNVPEFVELLKSDDALLERLIPYRRGIVAMRYRREDKEYGGGESAAYRNAEWNEKNTKCFLIVRSGERVHLVHSSLEKMSRMFPTQSDLDQPFTKSGFWHGVDSERITVEDVKFSEARSKFDDLVLHYRRLLILIAGLYDRERHVLGDIAALSGKTGLALLSLSMQEAVFRPISDEEFALGAGRPDFYDWLAEKNAIAQSGSRLLCNWYTLMTSKSAPGAVTSHSSRDREYDTFRYKPAKEFEVVVAHRDGGLVVECAVSGYSYSTHSDREFRARVDVDEWTRSGSERGAFGFLCLDDVTPEEINYYIYTRHERSGYLKYIDLLLAARAAAEADLAHEAPLRRRLIDALQQGGLRVHGAEDSAAVSTVIRHWRAAHRGRPVPLAGEPDYDTEVNSMAKQLWVLAGQGRDRQKVAAEIAAAEGRQPLRLALSGRTKLYLYATATAEEREDLLGPPPWVVRLTLDELKTKVTVSDRRHVILPKLDAKEEVLHEWPGAAEWIEPRRFHDLSYEEVRALRNIGSVAEARIVRWLSPRSDQRFDEALAVVKADSRSRTHGIINHGYLFVPLLVARHSHEEQVAFDYVTRRAKTELVHKFYVGGLVIRAVDALHRAGTPDQRKKIVAWFRDWYQEPSKAVKGLGSGAFLGFVPVDQFGSLKELTGREFVEVGERRGKRTWDADRSALLQTVKDRSSGYSIKNASAEPVLAFGEAAAKAYTLLSLGERG
jgi:hypothetical protein